MMPKRLCLGLSLVVLLCSTAVLSYRITSSNETLQDKQDETLERFLHRLQAGPDHYTNADRVLFGIVILIGFEILQLLTYNIGSEFIESWKNAAKFPPAGSHTLFRFSFSRVSVWVGAKEIPVRGKHLDELGLVRCSNDVVSCKKDLCQHWSLSLSHTHTRASVGPCLYCLQQGLVRSVRLPAGEVLLHG